MLQCMVEKNIKLCIFVTSVFYVKHLVHVQPFYSFFYEMQIDFHVK